MWKKILLVALLAVTGAAAFFVVQVGPRNVVGLLTYGRQAVEGTLQVGDPAPVVSLASLDGATTRGLDAWFGPRPLVLVFGSFT